MNEKYVPWDVAAPILLRKFSQSLDFHQIQKHIYPYFISRSKAIFFFYLLKMLI